MIDLASEYQKVVQILSAPTTNLVDLAALSGRDNFRFYNGADLIGVDLTGQDLRGLNFDKADIRFCRVDGIVYDHGAFNGSLVDETQQWLQDEFEFNIEQLRSHDIKEILIFCRLRTGFIDEIIDFAKLSYREFSIESGVSTSALRKARNGGTIAFETAVSVASAYERLAKIIQRDGVTAFVTKSQQPYIEVLYGGKNGSFLHLTPIHLDEIRQKKHFIDEVRLSRNPSGEIWRDTPSTVSFMFEYYSRHFDAGVDIRDIKDPDYYDEVLYPD